jgi:MYXO-CTERM domain-containing protein
MTALSHTIYSVGLFLALVALWLWAKRRRRVARMVRRAVSDLARTDSL